MTSMHKKTSEVVFKAFFEPPASHTYTIYIYYYIFFRRLKKDVIEIEKNKSKQYSVLNVELHSRCYDNV